MTGETVLTATVQDGSGYVPGSSNTASTRIRVADPAVTASFEQSAYTFDEAAGDATVAVILRTATGVPVPHADIFLSINTAIITDGASPDDFEKPAGSIQFVPSDFTADGTNFTARKEVTLAIVDDALDEPDEALTVILEPLPSTQAVVALSEPDGTPCPTARRCDATVTITDNDSAVATLSGLAVSGGGAELLTFASDNTTYTAMVANDVETLTFSATKSDAGASVAYLDSDGNTLDDADTTEDGFQVALAVGANAITVRVTAENGTTQDYTVTVTRAEGLPTVTVAAAIFPGETVAEGADAAFTLSRTGSTTAALTVTVTVSQTGAVLKDASAVPSSVTFAADAATAPLALETDDDDTDDDAGTVTVTLGTGTGYTVGDPGAATVAVSDNDVPVDFVLAVPATVAEDAGPATVTVTATTAENAPPATALAVQLARVSGTATGGSDYEAVSETVRFQVSDFAPATVDGQPRYRAEWTHDVVIHDDEEVEDDETVVLEMSPTSAFVLIHTLHGAHDAVRATLTIVDDDLPVVTIAADQSFVSELLGAAGAGFTLSRTGSMAAELPVTVAVTQEEDRDLLPDGAAVERTVTFAVGSATAALTVALENDDLAEESGVLTVEVQAGSGYTVGDPGSATVSVVDGDSGRPKPANLTAAAAAGVGEVVLSWDAHAPQLVFTRHQYRYKTDGNYAAWTDIPNSGQHDTGAGDGSNLTGYKVTGLVGGQLHTFQVRTYNSSSSASDPSDEATATPRSAVVSFGAGSYSVDEGGTVEVTVQLDAAPGREVTVPVSAAGAGGAMPPGETGADWSGVPENVTFGATDTEQTFTLAATDDTDVDAGESVALSFGTLPAGVTAGTPSEATVTITDNDVAANAAPAFTSSDTFTPAENQTAAGAVAASDSDTGDEVTDYALSGGVDQALFSIGSTSGALTFLTAPNYEDPQDANTDNAYVVVVQATSGTGDREQTGTQTITVTVMDDDTEAPSAPGAPSVSPASVTSLNVNWTEPRLNGGPEITGYEVQYRAGTSGDWTAKSHTGIATTATLTGLSENTSYQVQVRATNDEGTSGWSDLGSGRTDANAAPSFTSSETFDAAENQTAVGTVVASDDDVGDEVTGYALSGGADQALFSINDSGVLTFQAAPNFEDPQDADTGNTYEVTVQATSGTGDREQTAPQTITVTVTDDDNEAPSAPDAPSVSPASVTSLNVNWTEPGLNGGPEITGYEVQYRAGTSGDWTAKSHTGIATTATLTGLSENTSYQVQVRATNDEGTSGWSDSGSGRTDANAAPSFTSSETFDAAENQTAVGTVVASDDDVGDEVTGYALSGGADQALFSINDSGVLTFQAAPNFEDPQDADTGNTYEVTVQATSGTGDREQTAPQTITVTVMDEDEQPDKPAKATLAAVSGSSTSLAASWTAPGLNGSPEIIGYNVEYREGTTGTWTFSSRVTDDDPSAEITGLMASTSYQVRVQALNGETPSAWSDASDAVRTNSAVDNAPVFSETAPTRAVPENSAAGVDVGAPVTATPADSGDMLEYTLEGTDASSFDIESDSGQIQTKSGVTYNYEARKNSYSVTVKASDATASATVDVTINLTDEDEQPDTPAKPRLAAISGSSTSLAARWTKPGLNGGPDITGYKVEYREGTSGNWENVTHSGAGVTRTITGLTAGTSYQVQVRALNGETPSAWSDPSDAVTPNAEVIPPTVESVAVKSAPQSGDTYGWGETIVFTVTFSEKVRVTGQPQPTLAFDLGGSTREARYAGITDTDVDSDPRPRPEGVKVHFAYTVQPGDRDTDGIQVGELASAIELGGARIQSAADLVDADGHKVDSIDADLAHAALGRLPGHRVDGGTAQPPAGSGITIIDTHGNPLTDNRLTLRESTRGRYGFKLNTRPTHTVRVAAVASDGDPDLQVLPTANAEKAITPDEWETPFYLELRAAIDDDEENGERVFLNRSFSRDPAYHDLILPDVVVVEDDRFDDAGALSVADAEATEGVDDTLDFVVKLDRTPSRDWEVTVDYRTQDGRATAGSDYTSTSGTLTFAPGEDEKTVSVPIVDDAEEDNGETFTLVLSNAIGAGFASNGTQAVGTIRNTETPALTAAFEGVPASHDGESAFSFRVAFSDGISVSYTRMRDASFQVTAGEVTAARRVDGRRDLWEIAIEPASDEAVTVRLPKTIDCGASVAICTGDGRPLSHSLSATVAGPESNTAATGTPTVSGTPQVREELTASTSGISDAEGLDNASFGYQWIRTGADIGGATGSTYTPVAADEGKRLKVRVSFTDDAGNEESLTSAATDAVAAATELLTASFEGVPAEHAGQGSFSFRVAFSDGISISYKTVRDASFTVTGGDVTQASRVDGRRDLWRITVEPDSDEAVTVRLPETTDCGASGAICTGDGRPLSHSLSATVSGPVGISVADARVEEGAGAVLAFTVTLSRAASAAMTVDYATTDGTAEAGDDFTVTSGTLTFEAGDTEQTVEVSVLDDAHDEGEETMTLRLSNPSEGRLADAEATGTIENTDPLPRALLARFGRATALHVMEQVEERLEASRASGFGGRFAGRELRRGMERDMGRNFLTRLQSTAVQGARDTTGVQSDLSGAEFLRTGLPGGGDLLMGSGFVLNRETGGGASVSLWSRGMESRFSGRDGELSLDGGVRTTMFGADYAKGPLMAGLMLSHRRGLGGYQGADIGQVASSVTGLHPWVGYQLTERVTLWGVTGYGRGSLSLTPGEAVSLPTSLTSPASPMSLEGGLSMAMLAGGVRGDLVDSGVGGFGLAFKADALWVGTGSETVDGPAGRLAGTEAVVTRVRTALEASRGYVFGHGIALRPSLEVGLRQDGGDAETGAGADVAASLIASDPLTGLSVDVRVRTLLVHQAQGFRERGVSLSFSYDPTPSTPLGFTARVAPSWGGQAMSGADALWGRDTMEGLGAGGPGSGDRIDAELGYALPVGSRLVGTPRFGVTTSEYGRDYRLGYSLAVVQGGAMSFQFGLDAQRRESLLQEKPDHSLVGRLTVGW